MTRIVEGARETGRKITLAVAAVAAIAGGFAIEGCSGHKRQHQPTEYPRLDQPAYRSGLIQKTARKIAAETIALGDKPLRPGIRVRDPGIFYAYTKTTNIPGGQLYTDDHLAVEMGRTDGKFDASKVSKVVLYEHGKFENNGLTWGRE